MAIFSPILSSEYAEKFLKNVNASFSELGNLEMVARWAYITDITKEHETAMVTYFWTLEFLICECHFDLIVK